MAKIHKCLPFVFSCITATLLRFLFYVLPVFCACAWRSPSERRELKIEQRIRFRSSCLHFLANPCTGLVSV